MPFLESLFGAKTLAKSAYVADDMSGGESGMMFTKPIAFGGKTYMIGQEVDFHNDLAKLQAKAGNIEFQDGSGLIQTAPVNSTIGKAKALKAQLMIEGHSEEAAQRAVDSVFTQSTSTISVPVEAKTASPTGGAEKKTFYSPRGEVKVAPKTTTMVPAR